MRVKKIFLLSLCVHVVVTLCCQTVTFTGVTQKDDIWYFPPIETYCNSVYRTDSFEVVQNKVVFDYDGHADKVACFLFKKKDVEVYLREGDNLFIEYDAIGDSVIISGRDGACHSAYNAVMLSYSRYFYDLFVSNDISVYKDISDLASYEQEIDNFILNELLLMKDVLYQSGCDEQLLEVYYTNLFCSFLYSFAESNLIQKDLEAFITRIIRREKINLDIIKVIPFHFGFYQAMYNLDILTSPNPVGFIERLEYARHLPKELGDFLIQHYLLLHLQMLKDLKGACEYYQIVKHWTDFGYFKGAEHLFEGCK